MNIEKKMSEKLSSSEKGVINQNRIKEFGEDAVMNFNTDYEPDTLWFFVKEGRKLCALGGLRPIKIEYNGEVYEILGICSIISIVKGKGYGKALIDSMIKFSKETEKTLLGFTVKGEFFAKAGLIVEKDFIKRFIYKNPLTGAEIIDEEGDGIYYNGKDSFVSKVLAQKDIVYINVVHW